MPGGVPQSKIQAIFFKQNKNNIKHKRKVQNTQQHPHQTELKKQSDIKLFTGSESLLIRDIQ